MVELNWNFVYLVEFDWRFVEVVKFHWHLVEAVYFDWNLVDVLLRWEEVYLRSMVLFLLQQEHFDRNLIDDLTVGRVRLYRSVAFAVLQIFRRFPVAFVAGGFGQSLELVTVCEEDVVKDVLKLVLQLLRKEA
jgi:hypothetical protein